MIRPATPTGPSAQRFKDDLEGQWDFVSRLGAARVSISFRGGIRVVRQNDGPFLGTLNIRCRIIIGTQKGTIILTTTHMYTYSVQFCMPMTLPIDLSWT